MLPLPSLKEAWRRPAIEGRAESRLYSVDIQPSRSLPSLILEPLYTTNLPCRVNLVCSLFAKQGSAWAKILHTQSRGTQPESQETSSQESLGSDRRRDRQVPGPTVESEAMSVAPGCGEGVQRRGHGLVSVVAWLLLSRRRRHSVCCRWCRRRGEGDVFMSGTPGLSPLSVLCSLFSAGPGAGGRGC
jgi:hypothetical protein